MQYRTLGRTDIKISVIGMGCWPLIGGDNWGSQDEGDSIAALETAVDCGVNFFDTAEGYGDGYSETVLGNAFARRRKDVVIASKVSRAHLDPAELRAACEASLRRLQTDYLDLYQIHWPAKDQPFEQTARALEQLQKEGKIRAFGVSNFGVGDLGDWLATSTSASNQLPYSLLFRAIEFEIQPLCVREGLGILCYCPLAQGLLTGKFSSVDEVPEGRARTRHFSSSRPQARHGEAGFESKTFEAIERISGICQGLGKSMVEVSLAWLAHQQGVASVLAGARRVEQVRQNAQAGDIRLGPEILRQLREATDALKQAMGRNADLWQSESRMR
jgi:myo-inositol catabolism protein IolS